ncbi:MAG: aspartate aminotransferase family protein [Candidatus Hydrogenedentes bacterium]|nr:aspartate aminotransferase family protein [Candidatus Hydrogenedentota bacterium]
MKGADMATQSEVSRMSTADIHALNKAHVIDTYGKRKLAFVRGKGMSLWDAEGREYLDFFAGIAVVGLGHCHPAVTEAIQQQAQRLVHVSNLYFIDAQVVLAKMLCEHSFADKWFFCNSGAEAIEAAIKLVRRYWWQKGTPKPTIVTAHDSFHGRTSGAMKATGQPKLHEGFEPLLEGFKYVDFDDVNALEEALTPDVGAVLLEPVQGEGGVRVPSASYFSEVRNLCDARDVLLVLDEVQTGLGRTGTLFAHTQYGIAPDIMALAKGLGNGVPIGAMGCTEEVASGFSVGSHASTFGGNPLSSAAAVATLRTLLEPGFIEGAAAVGDRFAAALNDLKSKHSSIVEVRARGLMIGVEMTKAVSPLVDAMLDAGIICGPAGAKVLRFLPPLIVTGGQVDRVVSALDDALSTF